jgi:CBS domain-containing protein
MLNSKVGLGCRFPHSPMRVYDTCVVADSWGFNFIFIVLMSVLLSFNFPAEVSKGGFHSKTLPERPMDFQLNLTTDTVAHAHPHQPLLVERGKPLRDVLLLLKDHPSGCVLVADDANLVGIFTERDALKMMANDTPLDTPIGDLMAHPPSTLSESDSVSAAIGKMSAGGYRRMPIVDSDGQPTGVVSVVGLLHYFVEHFPTAIYNLPPKPHHSMTKREGA